MDYAFFVGFDIMDFQAYSSLPNNQREQVRLELLGSVQRIVDGMGVFAIADPGARLVEILQVASDPDHVWGVGEPGQRGWVYQINPRTGELECIWVAALNSGGQLYQHSVEVGEVTIRATFRVGYSAENGPYKPE